MIAKIQAWLRSDSGKIAGIAGALVCVVLGIWVIHNAVGPSYAERIGNERVYICSETLKTFNHDVVPGEKLPVYSPPSGKNTGYPTEQCWWTADGKVADEPTYVLLNQYIGKPEPTFCPVCHRLVRMHNPGPREGGSPPPTQDEYNQRS